MGCNCRRVKGREAGKEKKMARGRRQEAEKVDKTGEEVENQFL